jgi:large conductance mechanosensitive channel protein
MAQANKPDSDSTRAAKAAAAKAAATARARAIERRAVAKPISGFMDFIRQQGVVGLAVGLVIGVQVKALVDQIVASFINPLLGLVLPGQGDLSKKTFTVYLNNKSAIFAYGSFLNVLISFLTVAAVIYLVVRGLKLDKIDKPKSA